MFAGNGEALESGLWEWNFAIGYLTHQNDGLAKLFSSYGSDKAHIPGDPKPYRWNPHSYAHFYAMVLGFHREYVRTVVECGIGTSNPELASSMGADGRPGASLRAWRDYFVNAQIYGGDIDEDCLFAEERIRCFQVDQTSGDSVENFWRQVGTDEVDVIVDDGLHTFEAGREFFEGSIGKLRRGGWYFIEDVHPKYLEQFRTYFSSSNLNPMFVELGRPGLPIGDNVVIAIRNEPR